MLGWRVFVYRFSKACDLPTAADVPALSASHVSYAERTALFGRLKDDGFKVAEWSEAAFGLRWIDQLEKDQRALALSQGGYPMAYVGLARDLIPVLLREGVFTDVGRAELESCGPREWLLLTAWDLS